MVVHIAKLAYPAPSHPHIRNPHCTHKHTYAGRTGSWGCRKDVLCCLDGCHNAFPLFLSSTFNLNWTTAVRPFCTTSGARWHRNLVDMFVRAVTVHNDLQPPPQYLEAGSCSLGLFTWENFFLQDCYTLNYFFQKLQRCSTWLIYMKFVQFTTSSNMVRVTFEYCWNNISTGETERSNKWEVHLDIHTVDCSVW